MRKRKSKKCVFPFFSQTFFKYYSMKYSYLFIVLWLVSCADNGLRGKNEIAASSTSFVTNDTVSTIRDVVSRKPVASYVVPVNDPKLERTFGVNVYETSHTFEFLLKMHYEAMEITDTLKVPNFGVLPTIKINRGKDNLSCIVGFLDKKNEFKEYKMVTVKGDKMRLVVLKRYSTGRYRTVY